jgi:translation initiation factor IF-3
VKRLKANQEITAPEVRLVGTDGTHKVMPLAEALRAARNAKLDLVQVAGIACCCHTDLDSLPSFAEECSFGN